MHTVHLALNKPTDSKVDYAAMGIMFSVNDATIELEDDQKKLINDFFTSLKWDDTSASVVVDEVKYGDLMMMVNTKDRYVYKGSVTTPPCATTVYWNVLTTIYPIKAEVLTNFKKQLARKDGLDTTGNWREIQKLDSKHMPKIIKAGGQCAGVPVLIAFLIFFVILSVVGWVMAFKWKNAGSPVKVNDDRATAAGAKVEMV